MNSNKNRITIWKTGSFTKNFSWGAEPGLKRLYDAIRIGFDGTLNPTPRADFRNRLIQSGYIDFIPVNFFLYNKTFEDVDYVVVDELAYQALNFPHSPAFDRLAVFSLLLSEVGKWSGADLEQENPSEWARYYVIERMADIDKWTPVVYSANRIEDFLTSRPEFRGHTTRKLATNLSYFFNRGQLAEFRDSGSNDWFSNAIFLALDRYYMKTQPPKPTLSWALDVLAENDVADIASANTELRVTAQKSVARLFVEVNAISRFEEASLGQQSTLFAVLSRDPALVKSLPDIVSKWIRKRLFVEIAGNETELKKLLERDYRSAIDQAVSRIHNTLPEPSVSGDEILAIFRNLNDPR